MISWDFVHWRSIAHVKRNMLLEAAEDAVQTWLVFREIQEDVGSQDLTEVAEATTGVFRELLSLGLLEAGEYYQEGGRVWGLEPRLALEQVATECGRLAGGATDFGGCWFRATATGVAWVQQYYDLLAHLSLEKSRPEGP
ncbi:MAG: hypothetical protein ACRERD_32945 [Candidatus Binatia bacterium]